MTIKEAIKDILQRRGAKYEINGHAFYTEESVEACLNEALQRFEGALEVDESDNKDLYWFDIYHNGDFKLKRGKYKLYAIPKEQSNEN